MTTLIPDEFRDEVLARGTDHIRDLTWLASSVVGTSEERFVEFAVGEGWSSQLASWLYLMGRANGPAIELALPHEPIRVSENREFKEWQTRKNLLLLHGSILVGAGLLLNLILIVVISATGRNNSLFAWPGMAVLSGPLILLGVLKLNQARGRSEEEALVLGIYSGLLLDKNSKETPSHVGMRDKGSSSLSDW